MNTKLLKGLTEWMFVVIMFEASIWVNVSYIIAIYSMLVLEQVYTMTEIAAPAVTVLMATLASKVIQNIFKNNDGVVFGTSNNNGGTDE